MGRIIRICSVGPKLPFSTVSEGSEKILFELVGETSVGSLLELPVVC